MSNDMSGNTGAAIPDDVMERSTYAILDDGWCLDYDPEQLAFMLDNVVLPLFTPAIERNLLTRIADDAHARGMEHFARNGMDTGAEEMFEREDWIRSYLPTEDEEAK